MNSENQDGKTEPTSQATGRTFDLTNSPFNMIDWDGENLRSDVRWKFGMPPVNNAN